MHPRSWLFVPGDSPRKMQKARDAGADALILDLEDSVPPDGREAARAATAAFLAEAAPMPRYVRVNALDTGLTEADVDAMRETPPDGWVLPKCEGADHIEALARITGGTAPILAIATETAAAVRSLMASDWSHPRLVGMAWGAEDLSADLGAITNKDADGHYHTPFRMARDAMLFAAKAAGVAAIDGIFPDFRDPDGLTAETRAAREVGFDGKLAIHPAQAEPINAAFTPSEAEIDHANRVIAAMEAAGGGVAQLDGKMLDQPHLKQARLILSRVTHR